MSNELFEINEMPKIWAMEFYLSFDVAHMVDDQRRNILYLTDNNSRRYFLLLFLIVLRLIA